MSDPSRLGKVSQFQLDILALAFKVSPSRAFFVLVSHVSANVANILAPWFLGFLVASFGASESRSGHGGRGIFYAVLIYVALFCANMILRNIAIPSTEQLKIDLETNLSLRELRRSYTCSSKIRSRANDSEVTWAMQNAGRAAATAWENFVFGPLTAFVGILAGLIMVTKTGGWITGGVFLLACLGYILVSSPLVRRHRNRSAEFVALDNNSHSHTVDVVAMWREAKIFGVNGWLEEHFLNLRRSLASAGIARARATRNLYLAQSVILSIAMLALIYSVALSGKVGPDLVGNIVAVSGICTASIMSLQSLGFGFSAIVQAEAQWKGAIAVLENTQSELPISSANFSGLVPCVAGRPTWVIGPSGAGKSSLLEELLGLRGTSSQLERIVNEEDVPVVAKGRVAYLPQENRLIGATVEDNIRLGRDGGETETLLERLGLDAFTQRGQRSREALKPTSSSTSGGESRRIVLLRTLLDDDAELIVLDEPTAGLDQGWSDIVWELIIEKAASTPVIVATHDSRAPRSDSDPVVWVSPRK
ncbi:ATP-binding cassette domain-containing protein [Corynebacterium poyangense]|uniref:ATP-binding cassette domain-containing protein n=1 Tax=Corynebacterium poyangense TaxID=2684405 RepID=A0A7H0SM29_9CORY|nr:ABC transporter ATP-binding protein [Corynebacterium poyangense]QNQ89604.1 ATP-binding cassette domain-containing protein [Corynebacterium poyangense]